MSSFSRSPTRLRALGFALMAACACAPVQAAPGAAFDRRFEQLDSGRIPVFTREDARRELAGLRALLPAGDARRALNYEAAACSTPTEDMAAAHAAAARGVEQARRSRNKGAEVRFLYCRGQFAELVLSPRHALADFEAGLALARTAGEPRLVGDGLLLRGTMHSQLGDQARALIDLLAAQRIYDAADLQWALESNLQAIAITYRRMGEHDAALKYLTQSRAVSLRRRNWAALVSDELQIAFAHEDEHRPARALEAYARAMAVVEREGIEEDAAFVRLGMAYSYIMLGRHAEALQLLDRAEAKFVAVGDRSNNGMLELRRGEARGGLGNHAAALVHLDRAVALFEHEGSERYLVLAYAARAATQEALGRTGAALADYKRFMALREKLQRQLGDQRTQLLRHQFDADRREIENRRLVAEKTLRDQQLRTLMQARRWQLSALVLGGLLVVLLAGLAVQQLRRARRLRALAHTDELTGVANRRRLELFGESAIAQAHRGAQPLGVLAFDIDHFKQINDTHGHAVGDQVLAHVARACQDVLRATDLLGRTGGEEFVVVLPDTGPEIASQVAERLRLAIERLDLDALAPGLRVSISVGLARLRRDDRSLTEITRRADLALYRAKHRGRNRVESEADAPLPA